MKISLNLNLHPPPRRASQGTSTHAWETPWFGAGRRLGRKRRRESAGSGLASKQSAVDAMEKGAMTAECISASVVNEGNACN